jgi:hypothetical protein
MRGATYVVAEMAIWLTLAALLGFGIGWLMARWRARVRIAEVEAARAAPGGTPTSEDSDTVDEPADQPTDEPTDEPAEASGQPDEDIDGSEAVEDPSDGTDAPAATSEAMGDSGPITADDPPH